jgi:hypothetical protein
MEVIYTKSLVVGDRLYATSPAVVGWIGVIAFRGELVEWREI